MSLVSRTLGSGYSTVAAVRKVSGIPAADVSDPDMAGLIVDASAFLHGDITQHVFYEEPVVLNAGRTRFQTRRPFIADRDVDKAITSADITVQFLKRDTLTGQVLTSATGVVTIEDAARGVFSTANALPDGYSASVEYDHYRRPLDLALADDATAYLAAHMATLRLKNTGNLARADLTGAQQKDHGNRVTSLNAHRTKYLKMYEFALGRIRGAGGVIA